MVVMGKKGDKANPWDRFIIACMSIISALPSSTLHCSHCSCYFHIEPLHFSLIYSPPCEIYFCIQQSEWPIAPSPHFLASLCPFCIIPAVLSFLFIQTARERHSCVMNGTKYSRSPISTKPSLPTSNPLWLPGVFHLLITMAIILHLHCSPYPPLHVQLSPSGDHVSFFTEEMEALRHWFPQ